MRDSLKIRTLLMLFAALCAAIALSFPAPAVACWLDVDQECYYSDGTSCFDQGCDGVHPCPDGGTCYWVADRCCR
jgi:hypothetical protein